MLFIMQSYYLCILNRKISMAQIEENDRYKLRQSVKKSLRVDLTPMVDLGFLLITFFILTATLSQPTIANLVMPKDSKIKTLIKKNTVLTVMLMRKDSIAWYEGTIENKGPLAYCSYNNLRSVIQQKQTKVAKVLGDRAETVLIIYPGKESTYKNFIDVLDEIEINNINHYFVINAEQ
jgi:biopolymer transport protein ExbD